MCSNSIPQWPADHSTDRPTNLSERRTTFSSRSIRRPFGSIGFESLTGFQVFSALARNYDYVRLTNSQITKKLKKKRRTKTTTIITIVLILLVKHFLTKKVILESWRFHSVVTTTRTSNVHTCFYIYLYRSACVYLVSCQPSPRLYSRVIVK